MGGLKHGETIIRACREAGNLYSKDVIVAEGGAGALTNVKGFDQVIAVHVAMDGYVYRCNGREVEMGEYQDREKVEVVAGHYAISQSLYCGHRSQILGFGKIHIGNMKQSTGQADIYRTR